MKLRWGILGLGKIAHQFCNDLLLLSTQHEIGAVASRSAEKAAEFGTQFNVEDCYGSYDSLFLSPDIDIIYIATPHRFHKDFAIAAMDAGKHVLCEKPLGINRKEVEDLIEASKRNNVFLMEALWTRFNPVFEEVLSQIEAGLIGQVRHVVSSFAFAKSMEPESRLFNPELAGGAILDVGIYPAFLSYMLLGNPIVMNVMGELSNQGVDIDMVANWSHAVGYSQIMCGFKTNCDMTARIYGTEGSIIIDPRWHESTSYQVTKNGVTVSHALPKLGRGYCHEIMECHLCISTGLVQSAKWSHQNSIDLITILDDLREAVGVRYPFER